MATFRKRKDRWQVRIQRIGLSTPIARTFELRKDAEFWAREVERQLDLGTFQHHLSQSFSSLGDLLTKYAAEITPKKRGAEVEKSRINRMLNDKKLRHLAVNVSLSSGLSQWRDARLKKVSGSTVNRELNIVSHAINLARKEWGMLNKLPYNPVELIQRPKNNKARDRRLEAGEYALLLKAAKDGHNAYLHDVIVLAVETGMRQGEIVGIKRNHINTKDKTLTIPETKNGEVRVIPLSTTAFAILSNKPFLRVLDGVTARAVQQSYEHCLMRARKRAPKLFKDLRFHDLRHEAISRLFEKGLNQFQVAAISGHKTLQMLKRYTHIRAADLVKLVA